METSKPDWKASEPTKIYFNSTQLSDKWRKSQMLFLRLMFYKSQSQRYAEKISKSDKRKDKQCLGQFVDLHNLTW